MVEQKPNGVSSSEEFRAAAQADREQRAEVVELPSGLKARLVKPRPWEIMVMTGLLPQSVAAAIAPDGSTAALGGAEVIAMSRAMMALIEFVFVSPRVPAEARLGVDIPFTDVEYAVGWARGEVAANGQSLAQFRGQREGPGAAPPA